MKKITFLFTCLLLITMIKPVTAIAQQVLDSTRMYQLIVNDGSEFIGNIVSENDSVYQFLTGKYGQLSILKQDVKKLLRIEKSSVVNGKLWFENPQSSRYFFMPNGYGLKKGEGYYQNIWVLFNQASVGVTDNFSVGVGMIPLFLFGVTSIPVWIVPKVSIPIVKDKFNMGVGAFMGAVLGESNTGFGILYGSGTIGDRNKNLSVGLGYGYAGGSFAKSPLISFGGMVRVSPRGYLLTENYYIKAGSSALGMISLGGRSILSKAGLDYGVLIPIGGDLFIGIPWLGITVPFGNTVKPQVKK